MQKQRQVKTDPECHHEQYVAVVGVFVRKVRNFREHLSKPLAA
jgi:hypothetical protein